MGVMAYVGGSASVATGVLIVVLGGRGIVDEFRESDRQRPIELKDVITGLISAILIPLGMLPWLFT